MTSARAQSTAVAAMAVVALAAFGGSCSRERDTNSKGVRGNVASTPDDSQETEQSFDSPHTDLQGLRKLCVVPDFVSSAMWSTCHNENDWALVALLTANDAVAMDAIDAVLSGPSTQRLVFGSGCAAPKWAIEAGIPLHLSQDGDYTCDLPVFQPTAFVRSPLLHGIVIRVSDRKILIALHTT